MNRNIRLSGNTFYVGVNDRRTQLFENLWPLPEGISYNAYLINDEKTVLIDTVEVSKTEQFIREIRAILGQKPLDYLIVNHTEPDHSGALIALLKEFPGLCVVGNRVTFRFLDGFYGDCPHKKIVEHGDVLSTGEHTLRFIATPMIHWPETMMTFDETDGILFSGDAFGSFKTLDGGVFDDEVDLSAYEDEMRRYYSNIVGKYGKNVQRAYELLRDVPIKMIASTHGPVFRKDPGWVLSRYDAWSQESTRPGAVVIYGSMYGHTEEMADHTARKLKEFGVPDVLVFDASKTHPSYILSAVWKYSAVVLASPAYNNDLCPSVKTVIDKFLERKMKSRYVAVIGTATWSGGGVKTLKELTGILGWDLVGDPVEAKYGASEKDLAQCATLAKTLAERILK
ncbi:MAG: FprA family A-type flavoprotein [Candidatus Marinimicrobia bacterium]|nr:FprA family A-type flavoprotein [Candidatus Neomarinimicrobiota bacterium]